MIPAVVFARDFRQRGQIINHTGRSRSRDADNAERSSPFIEVLFDCFVQFVQTDMKPIIGFDLAQTLTTESQDVQTLLDGIMTLLRCVDGEIASPARAALRDLS